MQQKCQYPLSLEVGVMNRYQTYGIVILLAVLMLAEAISRIFYGRSKELPGSFENFSDDDLPPSRLDVASPTMKTEWLF